MRERRMKRYMIKREKTGFYRAYRRRFFLFWKPVLSSDGTNTWVTWSGAKLAIVEDARRRRNGKLTAIPPGVTVARFRR